MLHILLTVFLFSLQLPAQTSKHLTLSASPSVGSAAPGSKVSLYLDVTPNKGIHVYAPGAKNYRPISIKMDRHAGAVAGRVVYPRSTTMEFEGEKIPVYEGPFRLAQEMTVARSSKTGTTLTLTGSVAYQACDDHICFIPVTMPVAWTITVK